MHEVEAEFGGDIREIIQDLREIDGGNTWRTVAGVLGVHIDTLGRWRQALGMPVGRGEAGRVYDPTSFPHGVHTRSLEHKAIENGYASGADWVVDLRVRRGMTLNEAADALGFGLTTVSQYTPEVYHWHLCGVGGKQG